MGSLRDFDLAKLKERFRLRVLVETGTGEGHSLIHALRSAKWDGTYSIESDPVTYGMALSNLRGAVSINDNEASIRLGRSVNELRWILNEIAGKGPALFWLDAHFPGNLSGAPIDDEKDMSVRLPLEEELRVIVWNRDVSLDLFIIDDAWIYRDGIAGCGDWEEREAVTGGATDGFIWSYLGMTHVLFQDPRANGYTIGIPRNAVRYMVADALGDETKLREF